MISTRQVWFLLLTAPLLMGVVTTSRSAKQPGAELIGSSTPGWSTRRWANSLPLRMESLEGKVVLVRWFTDTCPYCAATAPALKKLHKDFASKGLVVIGMYHPKPMRDVSHNMLAEVVEEFGFDFPVTADPMWELLQEWWLRGEERDYTSVSFLMDKTGHIRLIHPGPQFSLEPGPDGDQQPVKDYEAIRKKIQQLLKQK